MTKRKRQSDHDSQVKAVAVWLKDQGYTDIKAHIIGYNTPEKITWTSTGTGHIPDNSGIASNGERFIFEVETDDSIDDTHTEDQWKLFSAYIKQHGGQFWVVVPENSMEKAKKRVVSLGVSAKVWGFN